MKSVLSKGCCEKKEKPFPKLMIHSCYGSIYLMKQVGEGTIVHVGEGSLSKLGDRTTNTLVKNLSDYEGDVCLTND